MNQKKQQIVVEITVGLFMLMILAALFVLTVMLSREALFRRSHPVEMVFDSVSGLRPGDNVGARGVTIGKVNSIRLEEDGVHVFTLLDTPIHLKTDYRIEVKASSVLGGRFLEVQEGSREAAPLPEGTSPLYGSTQPELMDVATETVAEIRDALNDGVLDDLKITMAQIKDITVGLNQGRGTLGRLLVDATLYDDLEASMANIRTISTTIASGEGTIGKLVQDQRLYDDATAIAANLKQVSDNLASGNGMLGKLLSPDNTAYDDLAATLAALHTLSDSLAKGEGTIGKLMSDEDLYLEIKALVREARAAVDDIRETSPITTFSSIFFGAF